MVNAFYTEEAMVVASTLVGSLLSQADEDARLQLSSWQNSETWLAAEFMAETELGDREQDDLAGVAYDPNDARFDMD